VESARNGHEALDRARGQRFDAIVMASEMPVMDGYMATMALRSREAGSRVPIIALTADASSAVRDACLTAGMDDFLVKPLNLEALRAMLSHWLTVRSRASAGTVVLEVVSTVG
jgi:CheY-like chemotaxis protein